MVGMSIELGIISLFAEFDQVKVFRGILYKYIESICVKIETNIKHFWYPGSSSDIREVCWVYKYEN